jgi:hypothetical protein
MTPLRRRVLTVASVTLVQSIGLFTVVTLVELTWTGPNSLPGWLRWVSAILWFPVGYLPQAWFEPLQTVSPALRVLVVGLANGVLWGLVVMGILNTLVPPSGEIETERQPARTSGLGRPIE